MASSPRRISTVSLLAFTVHKGLFSDRNFFLGFQLPITKLNNVRPQRPLFPDANCVCQADIAGRQLDAW
jgi:hypothetical protein